MHLHFHRMFAALVLAGLCFGVESARAGKAYQAVVSAGQVERRDSVVSFDLPETGVEYSLYDEKGEPIPFQTDWRGRGSFILAELPAGASRAYQLKAAEAKGNRDGNPPNGVRVTSMNGKLKIAVEGRTVLEYQAEKSELPRPNMPPVLRRGGYIHPILSPSGKLITDSYPSNHPHHHGIWFPWTRTEFEGRTPDFWNMGGGRGTVEFVSLGEVWSGAVHGGYLARHRFVDLTAETPKVALHETWEVRVYRAGTGERAYWMFDLISTQECAGPNPLRLPQYHYGGLGVRGNWDWNGRENTFFLTSEGETDRVKGNATRGRWAHMGGKVDGELTGLAILGHPGNFRAPQPMRLHPSEPFFCFAPSQLGDWEISPGRPYISRYRFIARDGAPDAKELERFWQDYAHPVSVRVETEKP